MPIPRFLGQLLSFEDSNPYPIPTEDSARHHLKQLVRIIGASLASVSKRFAFVLRCIRTRVEEQRCCVFTRAHFVEQDVTLAKPFGSSHIRDDSSKFLLR